MKSKNVLKYFFGIVVVKLAIISFIVMLPLHSYAQATYYDFTQSIHNADVTISSAPTSNGSFGVSGVFIPNASADSANVNITMLIAFLNNGTSVVINTANTSGTAAGNIILDSAMTWTGVSPTLGLELNASNDININAASTTTTGSYIFNAYNNINIRGAMTITTGNMSFLAGNNFNLNSAASITNGDFTAVAGGWANIVGDITVVNGDTIIVSMEGAPEMNASLIPQVGLLLGCLFFLFGRKKENTEQMMTA